MASEQWGGSERDTQSNATDSFLENKESNYGTNKDVPPRWRRLLFSKIIWLIAAIMVISLLALILGLSIGLTQAKKNTKPPSHKSPAAVNPSSPPPAQLLGEEINLGYTTIQGLSYPGGISQWLGVRYAQPPLGPLRFAAPQNVTSNSTVQMATQVCFHGHILCRNDTDIPQRGNYCIGTRSSVNDPVLSGAQSEDCLNLDIYAPNNVTSQSKLPVYVFIQGGGFNAAYPTQNGSSLVLASGGQIMVIAINYRVSAYGFLASSEVQSKGSLNNGLKDQRMALQWIHDHIAKFGGDPGHVTLGGDSAGAGSVTLQLAAYNGRDDNLFHAIMAESQSFGALRTVDESQYQYDDLVSRTNCQSSNDTLQCLRTLDITTLQTQNILTRFPDTNANPLFAYNPALDHDFIADYTFNLYTSGRFVKLPSVYGDVSNEGTVFAPKSTLTTIDASSAWLQAQFPLLNETQLDTIQSLYPPENQMYTKIGNAGKYWRSTADAYGDLRYVCPGFLVNNSTAQYVTKNPSAGNWNYHYNATDPSETAQGLGVPHVAEQSAIWASTNPDSYKSTNQPLIPLMQSYWISFIRSYNPNTFRAQGSPAWDDWGKNDASGGNRLLVQTPGPNGDVSTTVMEKVDPDTRNRCATLLSWGVAIKQ